MAVFAQRLGVSAGTLRAMEHGTATVQIGAWVKALWVLDRLDDLNGVLAQKASLLEQARAPCTRVRQRFETSLIKHILVWVRLSHFQAHCSLSSTGFQPTLASGSNLVIAVAMSVVVFPKSLWSSTPSWLMMNVITPEFPYCAG